MVDNLVYLLVEVLYELFEVCCGLHAWFGVRNALDEVAVGHHDGRQDAVYVLLAWLAIVQRSCHTLGEKLAGDVIDGMF